MKRVNWCVRFNSLVNRCAAKDKNPRSNMSNIAELPCPPTQWARAIKTSIWMVNRDPKWWIAYNMLPKQGHVRVRLSNIKPLPLNINQPNFATFDLVHILQKKHLGIHTSHRFSYPKKHRIVKKKSASQYGWAGHRYIQVPAENNMFLQNHMKQHLFMFSIYNSYIRITY